jgi:hypothetical protein
MTPIRRSIRQPDGTVTIKSRRGPYRSDSISASGRTIVVELHPTHLVLREHGCRAAPAADYTQLELWAAKLDAEQRRRDEGGGRRRVPAVAGMRTEPTGNDAAPGGPARRVDLTFQRPGRPNRPSTG